LADLYPGVDVGEMINDGKVAPFVVGTAVTKGQLVILSTHVAGEVGTIAPAGAAALNVIGVALQSGAAGETVSVALCGGGGIVKVTNTTNAPAVGTKIIAGAAGTIDIYPATPAAGDDRKVAGIALMTFASGDTGLILLA